jgi:imidazolonepropionase-like amidohydrolase
MNTIIHAQSTFPSDGQKEIDAVYHLFENGVVHKSPGVADTCALLIYKGKIKACGPVGQMGVPENTIKHDLKGMHIYPSFIELNSGYGIAPLNGRKDKRGPEYNREFNHAVYWNEAIHPEVNAINRFTPEAKSAKSYREKGFGITLAHLEDGIARGTGVIATTGDGSANTNVMTAKASMHYSLQKGSSVQDYPTSLMGIIALLRQSFYDAEWYASAQPDETNYSLEAYNNNKDLPQFFVAQNVYDLNRISIIADEFDQEYIVIGSGESYQLGPDFVNGVSAIVAPVSFPDPIDMSDPDLGRFVSQEDLLHWKHAPFNPFYLQELDIDLALSGAEAKNAGDFFSALRKSVAMGLDADTALAGLTTTPAQLIGIENRAGKLETDYDAHFFIADGDVFIDEKAKIQSHWINGIPYIIVDPNTLELKGDYTLNVADQYYILQVAENNKALVLEINDQDTLKYKSEVAVIGNEVSFQYTDSTKRTYRLSGSVLSDNRIWDGRGFDSNGKAIVWSAIKRSKKEKAKAKTKTPTDSIPIPPSLIFPLTAYGFDSIPEAKLTLFKNGTLWTNDSLGIIKNASILIGDGKILAVGKNINPNAFLGKKEQGKFETIDLKGRHITPGIIDEHSHIGLWRGVNEAGQASTAEVRLSDVLNPRDINIYRQLSGGVTTSQLLHGSANPIGGQSAIIKLRWGQSYDKMVMKESKGFIKFAMGENVKQSNWGDDQTQRFPQTRMGVEQVYYDYFYRAKTYADLKKLDEAAQNSKKKKKKSDTPREPFRTDLELEALSEILDHQRFITCHSYIQSEILMLMDVADSMNFTLNTFTHILEGYKVADRMKAHGAAASTFSDWWAYKYEVVDAIPYNASLLNEVGVMTAINSDDPEMGRRLNQEAAKSVKYGGMTEEEALKMVTLNPAIMLHIDEYVGSLTVGKHADFVVWSDHPLSIYTKADMTYIDGIPYFDRKRSEEMEKRDQEMRAKLSDEMNQAIQNGSSAQKPKVKSETHYHCDTIGEH